MKKLKSIGTLILIVLTCWSASGQKNRKLDNPFFIFNNGLNKGGMDSIPFDVQAEMLVKYGFDGGKIEPNDYHTAGSLYEIYPASADKVLSPLGLWNSSRIVCRGNHIEHWLNGKKILEYVRGSDDYRARVKKSKMKAFDRFGEADKGRILLQDHGSQVRFRNLKIKETAQTN